ncbi:glycoside hydrolase family 113 [Aureitalea marina]|uniref:Glycoside hydrolase n=1 Tax=Aureitalea marina TaxID=930804 RepID=A0A2S7KLL5_9FLAO|nr:glycoside hydrolase TIM-barrel-like domain-containing protein [Aureitalea marina]PQB03517.1 glycoside hydrolase [Aureitalea marina]
MLLGCATQKTKINGVSFVASRDQVEQRNVEPLVGLHANFASVMPFGFLRSKDNPNIIYNTERQWFGETRAGARQYIEVLKSNEISIMLKPQIWIWQGEFTGYITMKTEDDWQTLESSYRKFILDFAQLAEETGVEIFCIGTELEQFIMNRPEFWTSLIDEVRQVYTGQLTYAANWDEYKRVPFWSQLDYIGIDAYFPVSDSQTPSVAEARDGWQNWKSEMQDVSSAADRPVVFTEYGYRSMDYSGKEPWNSDWTISKVNLQAQTQTTQALFQEIWEEDWFSGGFVWKWFINHQESGGPDNAQFTPQNKPVEAVIREQYSRN